MVTRESRPPVIMRIVDWLLRVWRWLVALVTRAGHVPPSREPTALLVKRPAARPQPIKPNHNRLLVRCPDDRVDPDLRRRRWSRTMRTRDTVARSLAADEEQLQRYGLPLWRSEADVAIAAGVSVRELRFFSQHRLADPVFHYVQFELPKRRGGHRTILAPKKRLKSLQRSVLRELVRLLPVSESAHGFRQRRSIATGASIHVGKRVVLSLDLESFFPTVTFPRVRGYLIAMGYGYDVAATLAALMTESERQPVRVQGRTCFVPVGERHCVQGAPTSPGMCNAILLRMDRRLEGLARQHGYAYTRYADDLTFSGDDTTKLSSLCTMIRRIVRDEGFRINETKTRVARAGARQRVTGVTVNEVAGLSRKERRRLRAEIHQHTACVRAGVPDDDRGRSIAGKLAYLSMLNSNQARRLRDRLSP